MAYKKVFLETHRKISTEIEKHCYDLIINHQKQTGIMMSWIVSRALECYFEKLGKFNPKEQSKESDAK